MPRDVAAAGQHPQCRGSAFSWRGSSQCPRLNVLLQDGSRVPQKGQTRGDHFREYVFGGCLDAAKVVANETTNGSAAGLVAKFSFSNCSTCAEHGYSHSRSLDLGDQASQYA